jgi:TldD protein
VEIARANARWVKRKVELSPAPVAVDVWQTPLTKDPFKIPLEDKAELLLAINARAMGVRGVAFVDSWYEGLGEWKLFASTEGHFIEQQITRIGPGYSVTATDSKTGEFVGREHMIQPMQAGWEYVENAHLVEDAVQIANEALEKLKAPSVEPGKKDLILSPENLFLTIHESVGHPTELDRALGYEANFAGTSFATVEKLNKLQYAAPHVTLYADKTTAGGLASCGYDDDGVKTGRWDLVKDGRFVGYQTTREQAGWIGEKASRGTSYAQDFKSFPFQRMPNVSLQAGSKDLGVKELIGATDDGIYIVGDGSWSIDHQRYNFQFGGQMFYEVKKGKVTRTLKDVAYQSNTLEFWNACDLVGGAREWKLNGVFGDGKGQPMQTNAVSHGCPPARFKGINILNTNARKKG